MRAGEAASRCIGGAVDSCASASHCRPRSSRTSVPSVPREDAGTRKQARPVLGLSKLSELLWEAFYRTIRGRIVVVTANFAFNQIRRHMASSSGLWWQRAG